MTIPIFAGEASIRRVREGLGAVRAENGVAVDFPPDVEAAALAAVAEYRVPDRDLTDVAFVTLDPITSTDLDQAFFIEALDGGRFRVLYAIADVPAFVGLGGVLDGFTRERGETVYCPDLSARLHPSVLADDAASLLPDVVRGAYVWQFEVADDGTETFLGLERAAIRSRAKLGYEQEQSRLEAGDPHPQILLLREVGSRRAVQEVARGAVSLPSLEQQVHGDSDGGFSLVYRHPVPVEDWNAQLSLMTGMAAARIMLDGGVGILRTMPPPADADVARVRSAAKALGLEWPKDLAYPDFIRTLDATLPRHAAFLDNVTVLMRGAGYTAFDGARPDLTTHSAIAAEYAHTTAPLRRLVDRFVLATCLALVEGREVEPAIRAALPLLPDLMRVATRRSRSVDRDSMDYLEAELLAGHEGEVFPGVVIEQNKDDGIVQLAAPAVTARCRGRGLPVGEWVDARLERADPVARKVVFTVEARPEGSPSPTT